MLRRINQLHGFGVRSLNTDVGKLVRFHFDDMSWRLESFDLLPPSSAPSSQIERVPIESIVGIDLEDRILTLNRRPYKLSEPQLHQCATTSVEGYEIHAIDATFGHVEDFFVDEDGWKIRYLIIDTRNWWPGRAVLISPGWISKVDEASEEVHVALSREQIQTAPAYDHLRELTRDDEELLHRHYDRPSYWSEHEVHVIQEGVKVPWRESIGNLSRRKSFK